MPVLFLNRRNALREESEESFRRLFVDFYPTLLSFARHYLEEEAMAEDLVQDVFVKVWETQDRLKQVEDLSAYMYQMVRFRCLNHIRNEKVREEAKRSFVEEVDITDVNLFIREETYRLVMKAMETLPPACRQIFSYTLEGYSAKDIAEELHIAVETVKKQKQIARRILKKQLGPYFIFFFFI